MILCVGISVPALGWATTWAIVAGAMDREKLLESRMRMVVLRDWLWLPLRPLRDNESVQKLPAMRVARRI